MTYATYLNCTPGVTWYNQAQLRATVTGVAVSTGDATYDPETTSSGTYGSAIAGHTYNVVQYATADAPSGFVFVSGPSGCIGIGTSQAICAITYPSFQI